MSFISLATKRRTIYHLGNQLTQSKEEINTMIKNAMDCFMALRRLLDKNYINRAILFSTR